MGCFKFPSCTNVTSINVSGKLHILFQALSHCSGSFEFGKPSANVTNTEVRDLDEVVHDPLSYRMSFATFSSLVRPRPHRIVAAPE